VEEEIDLRQYVDVIRRWLWLIVLSTVLAGGTAYFVSLNKDSTERTLGLIGQSWLKQAGPA